MGDKKIQYAFFCNNGEIGSASWSLGANPRYLVMKKLKTDVA